MDTHSCSHTIFLIQKTRTFQTRLFVTLNNLCFNHDEKKEQPVLCMCLKTDLISCLCSEGGGGSCPVLSSYILHNSLAYGADWSRLSLEDLAPRSPPRAESKAGPAEGGGHLRIQYESPTASFDTSLEDDAGRYIPEERTAPSTCPAAGPAHNLDEDAPSLSCLLATCSFYDHMLHVWRWDWSPDTQQVSAHCC